MLSTRTKCCEIVRWTYWILILLFSLGLVYRSSGYPTSCPTFENTKQIGQLFANTSLIVMLGRDSLRRKRVTGKGCVNEPHWSRWGVHLGKKNINFEELRRQQENQNPTIWWVCLWRNLQYSDRHRRECRILRALNRGRPVDGLRAVLSADFIYESICEMIAMNRCGQFVGSFPSFTTSISMHYLIPELLPTRYHWRHIGCRGPAGHQCNSTSLPTLMTSPTLSSWMEFIIASVPHVRASPYIDSAAQAYACYDDGRGQE
jgi:hypothetical protein